MVKWKPFWHKINAFLREQIFFCSLFKSNSITIKRNSMTCFFHIYFLTCPSLSTEKKIIHKNVIIRSPILLEKTRNRWYFNKQLEWAPLYSKLITSFNVFDVFFFSLRFKCLMPTNAFCCQAIKTKRNRNQNLKWNQDFPQKINATCLHNRSKMNPRRILKLICVIAK